MTKKRIAFVVQRYGLEVSGGSELLCRTMAERLSEYFDVEAIATCAINHDTWANAYPAGLQRVNGVPVRRFPADYSRDPLEFEKFTFDLFNLRSSWTREDEIDWMKRQGPYSSGLFDYLRENKNSYDAFVFFTYLYCTTYFGLPLVREKAFLVPAAHDEDYIYLSLFNNVFRDIKGIIFLSPEEQSLVHGIFRNQELPQIVAGMGIDVSEKEIRVEAFRKKYGLDKPYILSLGRIELGKGAPHLFHYFNLYKKAENRDLQLLLIGKNLIDIPDHPDIRHLGFVSEEDKYNAIAGAELLINGSFFESLSIVIMEAWGLGVPVLVNGQCKVMAGQCARSNGGLWYEDFNEFRKCLNLLLDNRELARELGRNGSGFVKKNYNWQVIDDKYVSFLQHAL